MRTYNNDFSLLAPGGLMNTDQTAAAVLSCNEYTEKYGLALSEKQALALADTQNAVLKNTGRIEFGEGAAARLISAFCDSPYISQDNYEETLHELIGMFYAFKNDTWDTVSDDELIGFMKKAFDGSCGGSLDKLSEEALTGLSSHIRKGNSFESYEQ